MIHITIDNGGNNTVGGSCNFGHLVVFFYNNVQRFCMCVLYNDRVVLWLKARLMFQINLHIFSQLYPYEMLN